MSLNRNVHERWLKTPGVEKVASLVRETPRAVTQAKLETVRAKKRALDLLQANIEMEATVSSEDISLGNPPSSRGIWEKIGLAICRLLHRNPVFNPRLSYSQCPICRRKYALPWAQASEIEPDVYELHAAPAPKSNATEEYIRLWGPPSQEPIQSRPTQSTAVDQNNSQFMAIA
jgi:hypothetical protein